MTSSSGTFLYGRSVKCIICMMFLPLVPRLRLPSSEELAHQFDEFGRLLDFGPMSALVENRQLSLGFAQTFAKAFSGANRHDRILTSPYNLRRQSADAGQQ